MDQYPIVLLGAMNRGSVVTGCLPSIMVARSISVAIYVSVSSHKNIRKISAGDFGYRFLHYGRTERQSQHPISIHIDQSLTIIKFKYITILASTYPCTLLFLFQIWFQLCLNFYVLFPQ